MEVFGKIIVLGDTMTVGSAGTFKKRTIVIETDEQYKQTIPVDFVQDKTEILNAYKVGESVKIGINIRGNEYNGKYYVSLNGWNINKHDTNNASQSVNKKEAVVVEDDTDLPF
jgi:hypothetical protein